MYLDGFVPSCRRPFAEGRVSVGDHSCPPDFDGANFSVPWTTGKADFAGQLNFFTASPPEVEEGKGEGANVKGFITAVLVLPKYCADCFNINSNQ